VDRDFAEAKPLTSPRGRARDGFGGDKELEAGSRAHYDDAAYYSKAYGKRRDDIAFYVGLAGQLGARAVLEYGVGNGRIALPLARAGFAVTGIDLSRAMLDDLEVQLAGEPREVQRRVRLRQGDMREVRLRSRYDLVTCPFNAFLHLYGRSDVESFLERVKAHLAPGGTFAFDVSFPNAAELTRDPDRAYVCSPFRYPKTGDRVRYTERFDYDSLRQILFVMMEFTPEQRADDAWVTPLAHRQFYPQELEALLHYNGFVIERASGDFSGAKLTRTSESIVLSCRVRPRRAAKTAAAKRR
jgi:SAM-dependent methyltransferase